MENPAAESLPKGSIASTEKTLTHVLYVDDEAGLLKVAKPILEMQGSFYVETVSSVEEAMEKMEKKTFDVIVSDYIMPGKDGLEFLKELRDSRNNIPFIIFTGKGREIVAIKALNLGANQYINKIGKPEAVYSELAHGIRTVVKGKKAEEALRDSEKEKSAVLDSMSELVVHQDLKHRILWANKKAADSVNMNIEQLKDRYCHELWAESVNPCTACPIEETIKTGQPQQREMTTPDGRVWSISGYPIKDANGNTTSIVEVVTNITEQKKAEEALRESEGKLNSMLQSIGDPMSLMDKDLNILWANETTKKIFGDNIIGKKCYEVYHGRKKPCEPYPCITLKAFQDGKVHEHDTQVIDKDGKILCFHCTANVALRDKEGKPTAVIEISRNITERKQIEKQLKESEEKYRKQFEKAMDAIVLANAETGVLVDCNRAATKLFGRKKSELIGKHQRILHPPEAIEGEFSRTFEQHRKEKEGQVLESQIITKNGEIRDVIINATVFELEGKRLLQGTFRDITERKRVEAELRREKELMEMVTANNAAALVIISKDFRILWANKFLTDSLGDIRGKVCYSTLNNLTNVCPGCGVKEILETGKSQVVHEQIVPGADGQKVWLEITAIPIRDKNGNLIAISELAIDITERKKMENKLLQQNEFLNSVLEALTHPFYVIDADDYTIQLANSATGFGILAENSTCYQVTHERKKPCSAEHPCTLEIVKKTRKPAVTEHIHYDKNGNKRNVEVHGYPIFDNDGNLIQMIEYCLDITEQKKAEEALRASEEKYRELLNGMNDTAWVIDFDGTIIDVNDSAVEVLGYSREEFRSIGLTGIDSNLDPEEIKGLVEGMPADEVQVFETAHTTKDGKTIPVEISSSLVTYKGKQAILSIARDITERKRAEEKLRQSEERYRTVFENTGTAMCILEEDKTVSMVNRRFEELSGYSQKEIEGKKWTDFVTKDYLERMKRYHEARRKRGGKAPKHYPFDFVNKKGQIRNGLLTITLIPGTKKSVASILDITESKKTEKALLEAEEKYRETIVNANVGIIGYGPEGEVKVLNPKMEQMTGFKRSEIPTLQDWFKKLYPNKEERYKIRDKWLKRMSKEGEVKEGHAIITTKDGKRRNFLFNAVRLESGDSIAFAEDITERKEAEEKLDGMMNELVAINEKLGVVGKLTRHDARNKLSVMANNVYLAKQKLAANHSSLEYLGDIESAIDQMEKIFDFARTYEMLGVEELSYMNVKKSVDEAAILFSGLTGAKLVNECQGLTVMADSLLRQLFYNLIDNTLKYGEKVSQIRVYHEEVGKDQLKLVYEDDGIGVPNDKKKKIFKEGYGKGTGYGLYLIKKICEAYGWTIQETGKPGKGAQFTMAIPKTNKSGKISYILN